MMKTQNKYSAIRKLCAKALDISALNILHRHSLNKHAQLSSGVRGLKFGLKPLPMSFFVLVCNEGSGEAAFLCRVDGALIACM